MALKLARSAEGGAALAREAVHAALALSPRLPELLDAGWIQLDGPSAMAVPSGQPGASAYLALRWIEGSPLDPRDRARIADPLALARRVARDTAEALSDLHGAGIAHGDVKSRTTC